MQTLESVKDAAVRRVGEGAQALLLRFSWCKRILRAEVGFALPGRFGVFHFDIEAARPSVPESLWVVFGDLAPAYFSGPTLLDWRAVLAVYVERMQRWATDILQGGDGEDIIPILPSRSDAATAMALLNRLGVLRDILADTSLVMPEV
jgi:hypothetical protein